MSKTAEQESKAIAKRLTKEFNRKGVIWNFTAHNPFAPKSLKKQKLREFVDSLSAECFTVYGLFMLSDIKLSADTMAQYPDTEANLQAFLEWLPRYSQFKNDLRKKIAADRKAGGFKE